MGRKRFKYVYWETRREPLSRLGGFDLMTLTSFYSVGSRRSVKGWLTSQVRTNAETSRVSFPSIVSFHRFLTSNPERRESAVPPYCHVTSSISITDVPSLSTYDGLCLPFISRHLHDSLKTCTAWHKLDQGDALVTDAPCGHKYRWSSCTVRHPKGLMTS